MLPSLSDPQHTGHKRGRIGKRQAYSGFRSAIGGKPYRVTDKTRLRFVLYRAGPDTSLINLVLRLIPRHPEHADVFFLYLSRCGYRKSIETLCFDLVKSNPYAFVRGEAWHVLARYRRRLRSGTAANHRSLTTRAIHIAKDRSRENLPEKWGVCHYLCVAEAMTSGHHSRWLTYQAPLLQSLVAPVLPDGAFRKGEVVSTFLRRSNPEPGLAVCAELHRRGLTPSMLGLKEARLPSQVANTLRELGVIHSPIRKVDPIAEILDTRYGAPRGKSWRRLLGTEYGLALGLLKQAEATFASGRSFWLACQNSFNQTVFLALQRHLKTIGHPATCKTVARNGQLVDFGVTLDANGSFSKNCPTIGAGFRAVNTRRNHVPVSHPYQKKTITQAQYLTSYERNQLVVKLRMAYRDLVALMP